MSIGQGEVKNVVQLLDLLQIEQNKQIDGLDVLEFLTYVWSAAEEIWKYPDDRNYTNHNLDHSVNNIRYFLDLDKSYEWSVYEKVIFSTACLLHDLGMQYNQWSPLIQNVNVFPKRELSPNEIRTKHTFLQYELINQFLERPEKFNQLKPFCIVNNPKHRKTLDRASIIAACHSGTEYLSLLQEKNNPNYRSRKEFGERYWYHPRLLAGMLIFCDELDGSSYRIFEPERYFANLLNEESKRHWMACMFIEQTVLAYDEDDNIHIKLRWQVPKGIEKKPTEKKLISTFVEKFRIMKIEKEIARINQFFLECNETKTMLCAAVDPLPAPITSEFQIKDSDLNILRKYTYDKKPAQSGFSSADFEKVKKQKYKQLKKQTQAEQEVGEQQEGEFVDNDRVLTLCKGNLNLSKKHEFLSQRLTKWYESSKEYGHFELQSGEHTDVYLNCRTLASDQLLINDVADFVLDLLSIENITIDNVLGIGTSAIPLAVCISHRIQSSVSFTMADHKVASYSNADEKIDYVPSEVRPIIPKKSKVLLVDDLISGGNVTKQIMSKIEKRYKIDIQYAYHFALFRLGLQRIIKDTKVKNYYWLMHLPYVIYSKDKDSCSLCQHGWVPKKESEMF